MLKPAKPEEDNAAVHFDEIAGQYAEEIPLHIREHLIAKWWDLVSQYFSAGSHVLDIGCGDGSNVAFLKQKGVDVYGVDFSSKLVREGKRKNPQLRHLIAEGNALRLDYRDNTFDIAFMIGVLHHIYSRTEQRNAVLEALRVVKKNGVVIIRESNLINPAFRFFWNYVFPLTSKIDRFGGENWISARYLSRAFHGTIDRTRYFTFIPNFTPQFLMPMCGKIESMLEHSPISKLAAHYLLVLKKPAH